MSPWLVFALLLSLAFALAYQLFTGRLGRRVWLYWPLIFLAFVAGEILAESMGWSLGRVGDMRLGIDLPLSLVVVLLLWFLGI